MLEVTVFHRFRGLAINYLVDNFIQSNDKK